VPDKRACFLDLKQFAPDAPLNSSGLLLEMVKSDLRILANLDQVAVGIAHLTKPFPAKVVERLSEKDRAFEEHLRLVGRRTATGDSRMHPESPWA
jgi:hypothetical protein